MRRLVIRGTMVGVGGFWALWEVFGALWWLSLIAYGLVAAFLWRPIAGHLAWAICLADDFESPTVGHWVLGTSIGLLAVIIWPLLGGAVLSNHIVPKVGAEREAVLKQREAHIAELEKELGLGWPAHPARRHNR